MKLLCLRMNISAHACYIQMVTSNWKLILSIYLHFNTEEPKYEIRW